jgi:chemotaxis protein CheY-P-specific phosphatase CheC
MFERVVHADEHIGLIVPQLELIQHHIPNLWLMKTIMWEAIEEIKPHLEYLLHLDIDMTVNHVNILSIN